MTAAWWQQWCCGAGNSVALLQHCQQLSAVVSKNSRKNDATNELGQRIQCQELKLWWWCRSLLLLKDMLLHHQTWLLMVEDAQPCCRKQPCTWCCWKRQPQSIGGNKKSNSNQQGEIGNLSISNNEPVETTNQWWLKQNGNWCQQKWQQSTGSSKKTAMRWKMVATK